MLFRSSVLFVIIMALVLLIFSLSLIWHSLSNNIFKSSLIFWIASSMLLEQIYRNVSSANILTVQCLIQVVMQFIYKINSKGPKMDPCGTPKLFSIGSEITSPIFTFGLVLVK